MGEGSPQIAAFPHVAKPDTLHAFERWGGIRGREDIVLASGTRGGLVNLESSGSMAIALVLSAFDHG